MSLNIVCPHCLSVNRIPQKEQYKKVNCGECKASLLESKVVEVNENTLALFVDNSDIPVVVDFWAPWCGPCMQMAPTFLQVATSMPLKVQFLKVNTDKEQKLGGVYGIQSIPTLILFKEGKEHKRVSGALDNYGLEHWVKE